VKFLGKSSQKIKGLGFCQAFFQKAYLGFCQAFFQKAYRDAQQQ
jgi:hypothetical protein